jgi:NAD(P)-dependent dehydrogenase (short-subunit alcohol dehydrogenase family)
VNRTVALVTGASRGIGAATAKQLALAGCDLVLVARSRELLERTADEAQGAGGDVLSVDADLSVRGTGTRVVDLALDRFGRLDAVVNNAARLEPVEPLGTVDLAELEKTLRLDVMAPLELLQMAIPALREASGRVLNVSSTAAHTAIAGLGAYCAAKAALAASTRVLALEQPRITWLLVQPGPVDTDMHVLLREGGDGISADRRAYYRQLQRDGALVAPEVAGARFAWLALHAPVDWSGQEIEPDDSRVTAALGGSD